MSGSTAFGYDSHGLQTMDDGHLGRNLTYTYVCDGMGARLVISKGADTVG